MKQFIIAFVLCINCLYAQNNDQTVLSYGIKLAYNMDKDKGAVFGIEISYLKYISIPIPGIALDIDFSKSYTCIHLGGEIAGAYVLGLDLGPTLYFTDKGTKLGITSNIFTGALLYPYYGITYFPTDKQILQNAGAYFKGWSYLKK